MKKFGEILIAITCIPVLVLVAFIYWLQQKEYLFDARDDE
jgi:hypothetical protein